MRGWPLVIAVAVALSSAAGGFWVAVRASSGVTLTISDAATGEALATVREPSFDFPTRARLFARYAQHVARDKRPHGYPPFRAEVAGFVHLEVPGELSLKCSGACRFVAAADSSGAGGGRLALPVGVHRVAVEWSGEMRQRAETNLSVWLREGSAPAVRLPWSNVSPDGSLRRWLAWLAGLVAGALALGLAFVVQKRGWLAPALTAVVLLAAAILRFASFDVVPEFLDTNDELVTMWNGWSFLDDGGTRGWSIWERSYGSSVTREEVPYFGFDFKVIRPAFDQPPLAHAVVGLVEHLAGVADFRDASYVRARAVTIALGLVSVLLLIWLAQGLERRQRSALPWVAGAVYAFLPQAALQGRVAKEEVLLTALLLLVIGAVVRAGSDEGRLRFWVVAAVAAGLAPLTKASGLGVLAAFALFAFARLPWRRAALLVVGAVALAATFPIYALIANKGAYLTALRVQSTGRGAHFALLLRWATYSMINRNAVGTGWQLLLVVGALIGFWDRRRPWGWAPAAGLGLFLFTMTMGAGNWTFGWYIQPALPLFALGFSAFAMAGFRRSPAFVGCLVWGVGVAYGFQFLAERDWIIRENQPVRQVYLVLFAVALAPAVLRALAGPRHDALFRRLGQASLTLGLAALFVVQALFVFRYERLCATHWDLDREPYFHSD